MGGVGYQTAFSVEDSARAVVSKIVINDSLVQTLFDVQTDGDLAQNVAHLLCNTHEAMTVDRELYRVDLIQIGQVLLLLSCLSIHQIDHHMLG